MNEFALLVGVYLKAWRNNFRKKPAAGVAKFFFGVLLYLVLGGGAGYGGFALSRELTKLVSVYPGVSQLAFTNVLMGMGLSTVVLILLSVPQQAYAQIYDSPDMAFLMSTPLVQRWVFATKLAGCYLFALSIAPLTLAPIIGVGIGAHAGAGFYMASIVAFFSIVGLVTSLAVLLIMLVMRYVPGQRMKQITMSMGLLLGLGIAFMSQVLSYKVVNLTQAKGGMKALAESLARLKLGDVPLLPHAWFAHGVAGYLPGSRPEFVTAMLPLIVSFVVLAVVVVILAQWVYLEGWSSNQEAGRRKAKPTTYTESRKSIFPSTPLWGLIRKELRLQVREPMVWYNFAVTLVVLTFLIMNNLRDMANKMGHAANAAGADPSRLEFLFFGIIIFVCSASSGTFTSTCLSREGEAWNFLRSMPLSPHTVLFGKFIVSALPPLMETWLAIVVVSVIPNIPFPPLWVALLAATLIISTIAAVMTCTDFLYPNFNIRLSAGSRANAGGSKLMVANLLQMVLLAIILATMFFPAYSSYISIFKNWSSLLSRSLAYSLFSLETIGLAAIAFTITTKRLSRMMRGE